MSNDFASLKKKLQGAIEDAVVEMKKPSRMRQLGEAAADMIRLRTRLGYGVSESGKPRERLKGLSADYKKARRNGELSSETSANKSNLTRTGQMLDSLDVTKVSKGSVEVGPTGSRNREVAQHVSEQRPFMNLSNTEEKRLTDQAKQAVIKLLGSILTKLK